MPRRERIPWRVARASRLEHDNWTCQAPTHGLTTECGWPLDVHHKLPRGRGGSNDHENLVTLCRPHHAWVESNRTAAYELGLLIRSAA